MVTRQFKIGPILAAVAGVVMAPLAQAAIISFGADLCQPGRVASFADEPESWLGGSGGMGGSSPVTYPDPPELPGWILLAVPGGGPALGATTGMTSPGPVVSASSGHVGPVAWYADSGLVLSLTSGWLALTHSRLMLPLPPFWELLRPA